jgi:hypothetical protein
MTNITRVRGDTYPDRIRIKDADGNAVDITGWTFTLTINRVQKPVDVSTQVVQTAGTIIAPATDGVVEFAWDDTKANQSPGTYYYDIQIIDGATKRRTPVLANYIFVQDITKS